MVRRKRHWQGGVRNAARSVDCRIVEYGVKVFGSDKLVRTAPVVFGKFENGDDGIDIVGAKEAALH
jgi:hypothetical protein